MASRAPVSGPRPVDVDWVETVPCLAPYEVRAALDPKPRPGTLSRLRGHGLRVLIPVLRAQRVDYLA